eukprot:snap_masked-scaffold_3-processed-gene-19.45-mRNA-1 protein AED:0.35 eAED:0.35 QI:0/-1/0/1/-1/1/1/0/340
MKTTLLCSPVLAKRWQVKNVFLKLENTQETGSFKDRAMKSLCTHIKKSVTENAAVQVVCSSGGNAGLAAANACRKLGLSLSLFLPSTTSEYMLRRILTFNPDVHVEKVGNSWDEADQAARKYIERINGIKTNNLKCFYAPPFDHEEIFNGNSTLLQEVYQQLKEQGVNSPDSIFVSVGGGGLATGVVKGCLKYYKKELEKPIIYCCETAGTASFNLAWGDKGEKYRENEDHESLAEIKSIAHSLGAKKVTRKLLQYSKEYNRVNSFLVSDMDSLFGIRILLDEHKILVEPACGAMVASVEKLYRKEKLQKEQNIVLVVCGGSSMTYDMLVNFENKIKNKL